MERVSTYPKKHRKHMDGQECGRPAFPLWQGFRSKVSVLLVFLLLVIVPCAAWTVPGTSGDCTQRFGEASVWYETQKACQFAAQLEPDNVFVGGEKELGTGYYNHPHVYEIENAIRLFKEKGYDNWALYLSSPDRFQALADGSTWADAYKGRLVAHISLQVFFVEVYGYDYDICNYAGFDQYYNSYGTDPAGKGLDSENIDVLAGSLPVLIKTVGPAIVEIAGDLAGVPGLGGLLTSISVDVRPVLQGEYPSGALQAQQHYDKAVAYFSGGMDPATGKTQLFFPQRSSEYNSLFQLGWTAHYIQDIGVIYHIHDIMSSFPPNPHNDFEDDAQGHGDPSDGVSGDYHVTASTWTLGLDYANKKITELARDEANAVDSAADWAQARSQDAEIRRPAVQKGARISEQFTAAVIAKYLTETGIPKVKQPFQGRVEDMNNKPVPYAYVFYRKRLQCVQDPDTPAVCGTPPGAWNFVRADKNGVYFLDLKPSDASTIDTYLVRPVMPGFRYTGYQPYSSSELMGATLDGKPLEYKPPWKTEAVITNPYYEFYLAPLEAEKPVQQMIMVQPLLLSLQPGVLAPSTTDALKQEIISIMPESPVLRVHTTDAFQQQMIPLPEESYVEVRLANLVDLNTPRVLPAPDSLRSTVLAAKDRKAAYYSLQKTDAVGAVPPSDSTIALKVPDAASASYIPPSTPEGWHAALVSLPKIAVKASNGTVVDVPDLSYAFGTTPALSGEFLPAIGMARVPAANAQVEVTLEPGPGAIGPGFLDLFTGTAMVRLSDPLPPAEMAGIFPHPAVLPACATGSGRCDDAAIAPVATTQQPDPVKKSLILTTNSEGKAGLMLRTGTEAGRIRLHFRVISNPDAPGILPEDTVEFMVHPLFKEPDPATAMPPVIQAVSPRKEEVPESVSGVSKEPVLCLGAAQDRTAVVVECPAKSLSVQLLDLLSSVTSGIGTVQETVWPGPSPVVPAAPLPCDDGDACTVMDRSVRGICSGDRIICPSGGRCSPESGCLSEPAPVTRQPRLPETVALPAEMTRRITPEPAETTPAEGSACDDGNACTARDTLIEGVCRGRAVVCDDGNEMTADECDPGSGCVFIWIERVPEETAPVTRQEPVITEGTRVVPELPETPVPGQCPRGCSCLTVDEATEQFGRYLPCSDTPCGAIESPRGTLQKYCLRQAG
jgi:hypothetical protein